MTLYRHLPGVSQQTKAGDIGDGMNGISRLNQGRAGLFVEAHHRLCRSLQVAGLNLVAFVCSSNQAGAKWFAQDEQIALSGPALGENVLWVNDACHRETIFRLSIRHSMSTSNSATGLGHDISPSAQNFAEDGIVQVIGPGDEINRH